MLGIPAPVQGIYFRKNNFQLTSTYNEKSRHKMLHERAGKLKEKKKILSSLSK